VTHSPYFPPANRTAQWFSSGRGTRTSNRIVCWHTTECEGWPAYTYNGMRGGSAPHWTCQPDTAKRRLIWRQHWRADESARALRNPAGGVDTNTTGVLQIELVGTCRRAGPGYFWPRADEWALRGLAEFSRWANEQWAVPLTTEGRKFAAYGTAVPRLSGPAWMKAQGHLGHQHVPENDHVDPGALDVPRLLSYAREVDDPMPTPAEYAKAVWAQALPSAWDGKPRSAAAMLSSTHYYAIEGGHNGTVPPGASSGPGSDTMARVILERLEEIEAKVDALAGGDAVPNAS
jgi:hypothetical protein